MKKSTYSVILSDDIVAEIDLLAGREGYSRSGFIDHILADYVSLCTPRRFRNEAISVVVESVNQAGLRSSVSSGGTLTLKTSIRYKYNPAIQYVVELFESGEELGELRIALRSQNDALLTYMQLFFKLWSKLEEMHLPQPPGGQRQVIQPKRYVRTLRRLPDEAAQDQVGEAIAGYISLLDACLKTYFQYLNDANEAVRHTENEYRSGMEALGLAKQL